MKLPFEHSQLDFVLEIAKHRSSFFDPIFLFLNYFDTPYFAAFLIPLMWFGFSYRWGIKVTYLFLTTSVVNICLKYSIQMPRPALAIPEIAMLPLKSPGFPSGGAQTAFLLGALFIYQYKNKKAAAVGIFYIILISFSRLYLGVHYPLDILGGWIAGGFIFLAFITLEKSIDSFCKKRNTLFYTCMTLFSIGLLFSLPLYSLSGAILTISWGALLAIHYNLYEPTPKHFPTRLIRGTAAGLSTLLFGFATTKIPIPYASPLLLGLWISLGIPLVFRAIKKCGRGKISP